MISVIIPVKNDRKIENILNEMVNIPKPEKTEILVVDASEGNLDDIKKKFPKARWIYFNNNTNKIYTFTEQINLGLHKAKGEIIVFIDADCIPKKDWLVELTKPIRNGSENYVTGRVISSKGNSFHDATWGEPIKYRSDTGSANTAFKKKILFDIGYYDENFEAGSDIDFSWRAIEAGYKILYNPQSIIFDDWGNWKQEIKRAIRYGEGRVLLYKKHPNRWKNLFGYHLDTILFPLFILLLPFTLIIPYYPLLLLIPLLRNIILLRNIKKEPFKKLLFDLIHGVGILKALIFPKKQYEPKH
jgi:cellulose synthase/poly-beta-1,6-N-acetylglucosamine synthase-like glycosyltransferase